MTNTRSARGLVWIDLQSPTDDEIASLVNRYALHPLVGEELKDSPSPAKVELYEDYMLVILTFPVRVNKGGEYAIVDREIDFVIGKNYLITAHPDGVDQLEYFAKIFETNAILNKDSRIEHTGHLFYHMMKRLYAGMYEDLDNIRDALMAAEERVFNGEERKMVEVLSKLSRELVDFRETARVHRDIWQDFVELGDRNLFGADFHPYIRDIRDEFTRINELILNSRELVGDLRETNDSLLNTKQNDIMKTLTIVTFTFIPATFISALFTIPGPHVPFTESSDGWYILVGVMVAVTLIIWATLSKKKWL